MKTTFTVFYSWQSDIKKNKFFIEGCIKIAIDKILGAKNFENVISIKLDRDTTNKTGSPDIADIVFAKIKLSDIFICDLSLINNFPGNTGRKTPNPNVLIELGYAINHLGWERIILINNLEIGRNEDLPFDIRKHRISTYKGNVNTQKSILASLFETAISVIIDDYDGIILRSQSDKQKVHDANIFEKLQNISTEGLLRNDINRAVNSLFATGLSFDKWRAFRDFYDDTLNHFIDDECGILFQDFTASLENFRVKCIANFFQVPSNEVDDEDRGNIIFSANKNPWRNEDDNQLEDRLDKLGSELFDLGEIAMSNHRKFVKVVKKNILI